MSKRTRKQKDLTRLAHAGRDPSRQYGFVNMPVYRGSTVIFPTLASLEADDQDFSYGRLGTPTVRALEEAIAELDGGYRTRLTPSGLLGSGRNCDSASSSVPTTLIPTASHTSASVTPGCPSR